MLVTEIINKKKYKQELTKEEIDFMVQGFTKGDIPDYQMSAFLMAVCFNGMNSRETADLTDSMMRSGDLMDLSSINGIKVDKHSTGGVGDKTSLVLGPMVASCGAKVAKMSGRGLGHTGGTIDKLESIPGFNTQLEIEDFKRQVNKVGIAIAGQSANLDPADKKMYALRDVTATVDSVPLIASSIMSKKLATGSENICLDVKYGSGAFCKTVEDAERLANAMVEIGKHMHRDTRALITNMDQPLGYAIGNILEVKEAVETLKGHGPKDLYELCVEAGSVMLLQSHIFEDKEEARKQLEANIKNGKAFEKLVEWVEAQGGDSSYVKDLSKFGVAKNLINITAETSGYIKHIDTIKLGEAGVKLGAGRAKKEDIIDFEAGIMMCKKPGDKINIGDVICVVHTNKEDNRDALQEIRESFEYSVEEVKPLPTIEGYVE